MKLASFNLIASLRDDAKQVTEDGVVRYASMQNRFQNCNPLDWYGRLIQAAFNSKQADDTSQRVIGEVTQGLEGIK